MVLSISAKRPVGSMCACFTPFGIFAVNLYCWFKLSQPNHFFKTVAFVFFTNQSLTCYLPCHRYLRKCTFWNQIRVIKLLLNHWKESWVVEKTSLAKFFTKFGEQTIIGRSCHISDPDLKRIGFSTGTTHYHQGDFTFSTIVYQVALIGKIITRINYKIIRFIKNDTIIRTSR